MPMANLNDEGSYISTAVAIDRDKNSQQAVKWAVENLHLKDDRIVLVHVNTQLNQNSSIEGRSPTAAEMHKLYLPYRGYCARKGIRAKEVILHDLDVASALCEYIRASSFTTIVLGASSRSALARAFKNTDVPTSVGASAPNFCSVYVVSKGKSNKIKTASDSPKFKGSSSTENTPSARSHNSQGSGRNSPPDIWDSHRSSPPYNAAAAAAANIRDREYNFGPTERIFGSSSPSPHGSADSNDFMHMGIHWDSRKSPLPESTAKPNYEPLAYANNFNSPQHQPNYEPLAYANNFNSPPHPGFGDVIMRNRLHPDVKLLTLSQSVNNLINLSISSASGSSDNSGGRSFRSDVSFEPLDVSVSRTSESPRSSASSQTAEIEDELRRLKLELKQITELYNVACREAITAREEVKGIAQWKTEEGNKLEEALQAQEAALAIVERERQKYKVAIEVANKAQRIADLESDKRKRAELRFKNDAGEKQKAIDALSNTIVRYRRYTIQEIEIATEYFLGSNKIGEGGYGPVFKATLDHTPVAIKVLRPDISQGQKQFQREVEVLSRMRHPHMVILLGACPEYGCIVYEYMENGSLDDRLSCKDGTPPIPWGARFRIAAEIATALNFLHQTRPEPLVHRDLKPGNILLDKNYVSKISDVGLARLVPPSIADSVTQYYMTAAAGTFCYIDPEYQQTGMLGTKSDIYSLGIMLLEIITAKPPMGLTHLVQTAIETGRFADVLDPKVKDWPVEEALCYAELALKCCELRRKDRPDLDTVILPELGRLRDLDPQNRLQGGYYYAFGQSSYQESSTLSQDTRTGSSELHSSG